MEDDEAPTKTQCPACRGHGRKHISGSMKLDEWGEWEREYCRICDGSGMVTAEEAKHWRRTHETPRVR